MPHFSNPGAPIKLGLPRNVRRLTTRVRKKWSLAEIHQRRRQAALLQNQLAFIASFDIC
jgi:hypothetical protein